MKTKKKISVIGCGWLGLPLAVQLVKAGFHVCGSTRTKEKFELLSSESIEPYLFDAEDQFTETNKTLFSSEYFVINIPPGRKDTAIGYSGRIKNIIQTIELINPSSKIIFTSSTSVYGNLEGVVSEESAPKPSTDSGKAVSQAEKIIQNSKLSSTILRLSGLVGDDRHPVKYLAGRKNLSNPDHPVNLIHLEDCIKIIISLIKNEIWDEVFNCAAPDHPSRKEYYVESAKSRDLEIPEFVKETDGKGKRISSQKIIESLNYNFIYTSPFDFK